MLPKYFKNFGILSCKMVLNVVLFVLYVYFFGIPSFQRYMEKSIVTITKDLDISSSEIEIKPGRIIMIDILINLHIMIFNTHLSCLNKFTTGIALLPSDPVTGNGWRNDNISHLGNKTGSELREAVEEISYLYDQIGKAQREV